MKIGVVTSGFDGLSLFKIFSKSQFDFHVYFDWNSAPYGDKTFEFSIDRIKKGVDFLSTKNVDFVIVPPIYELFFLTQDCEMKIPILPLFHSYLLNQCLPYSLVGKIGFCGDFVDVEKIQPLFEVLSKNYSLTSNQKTIKKFHLPFAVWKKEVHLWKSFLSSISFRNFALSKIIKFDLNYFKDAAVDTVIPLNYGYFAFQRLIKNKLNQNKIRFHGIENLEAAFLEIVKTKNILNEKYGVTIYCNGGTEFIKREKKWMHLLQNGHENNLKFKNI